MPLGGTSGASLYTSRSKPEEREHGLRRYLGFPGTVRGRNNGHRPIGEWENAKGFLRRVLLDIGILGVEDQEIVSLAICYSDEDCVALALVWTSSATRMSSAGAVLVVLATCPFRPFHSRVQDANNPIIAGCCSIAQGVLANSEECQMSNAVGTPRSDSEITFFRPGNLRNPVTRTTPNTEPGPEISSQHYEESNGETANSLCNVNTAAA